MRAIFVIEIFLAVVFGVIFVWRFKFLSAEARKKKEAVKKLLTYLPGTVSKFFPWIDVVYQGLNFRFSLGLGSEGSPPYLIILSRKNSSFKLKLMKESLLMKYEKISPTRNKVNVNDQMFNEEFLILSDKPEMAVNYFSNSEKKDAIKELFGLGFDFFTLDKRKMLIGKPNYQVEIDLEPQRVINVLQKLSILARGIY